MKTKKDPMAKPPIKVSPMKIGSLSSTFAPRQRLRGLIRTRRSAGKVSGCAVAVSASAATASTPRARKIARQSAKARTALPASGASMGEIEITSINIAIKRVACVPVYWSRMIARGTTISTAPPSPCRARQPVSAAIDGAKAAPKEATRNSASPTMIGSLRPA